MRGLDRIVGIVFLAALCAVAAPVRAQVCGDGVLDPGETCDPPNLAPHPLTGQITCRLDCTSCGDGVVDGRDTETCDVGPYASCGLCLSSCVGRVFSSTACPCAVDDPSLADIRARVLATCGCGDDSSSRRAFLRCARDEIALVSLDRIFPNCRRGLLKCLAHSVCGKPGAVTCCRTNARGRKRCSIEPDAARCTASAGGSAALGVGPDCCDACP